MENAFTLITSYLLALESRILALEADVASLRSTCAACCAPNEPAAVPQSATTESACCTPESACYAPESACCTPESAQPEPAVGENEVLFNLDKFSPDTIQNELWQQFRAASDAEKVSVIYFEGEYPRNIIVYASENTQPVYRNAGAGEVRVIQSMAGTHLLTLQPGESGKTCFTDGVWASC